MKRLITLTLSLMIAVVSLAQAPDGNQKRHHDKDGFNRMQSEKIGFLTSELDLTPDEAAAFFPLYNQYTKDAAMAHKTTMKALMSLNNKSEEELSDEEIEKRINAYTTAQKEEQNIIVGYLDKFKTVLPIKKVAKFYLAEEKFRVMMINQLRGPRPDHNFNGQAPAQKRQKQQKKEQD